MPDDLTFISNVSIVCK